MAINKKLIHFNSKENFDNKVANNEILDTSIVFVKDSKEIYTHGNLYKSVNWSELQVLDNPGVIYIIEKTAVEKPTMGMNYLVSYVFTHPVKSELKINFKNSSAVLIIESGSKEGSAEINLENDFIDVGGVDVTISPSEDKFYRYSVTVL